MFGFRYHIIVGALLLAVISAHAQQNDMQWIERGTANSALAIKFSADGTSFITVDYQGGIKRWETATGNLLNALPHPLAGSYWMTATYSAGGNYIVTPSTYPEPKLRLYNARTSELLAGADVTDNLVAISSDENYLVTGLNGTSVRLWSLPSMKELGSVSIAQPFTVGFTPDSKYVLVATTTGFEAYDVATFKPANILPGGKEGASSGYGFANNGTVLVGANYQGITFWDFQQGTRSDISFGGYIWGTDDGHAGISVADNGSFVAFTKPHQASGDSLIMIYDINARKWVARIDIPVTNSAGIRALAFTPDGNALAVATYDNVIRFYDSRTGAVIRTYPNGHSGMAMSSAFSVDGSLLLTGGADSRVRLWNAQTGEPLWQFTGEVGAVDAVAISSDGSRIAASGMVLVYTPTWTQLPMIRIWDRATGALLQSLPHPTGTVLALAFTPDGNRLVTGGGDGIVRLWDITTGDPLQTFIGHGLAIRGVSIDLGGNRIASASDDWTVKLWDLTTGTLQRTFSGHRGPVNSVMFTPDGAQLVSASSDSTIREWNISNGSTRVLRGHDAAVKGVGVSSDGGWIFSAGNDGLLNAWDRARGAIVYSYRDSTPGSVNALTSVSVDPGLRSIATTAADGSVMMWKQMGTVGPLSAPPLTESSLTSRLAAYPNPVGHQATVEFELNAAGNCSVSVVDALGNEVVQLVRDRLPAGIYHHTWNADALPNGVYYYRLATGGGLISRVFTVVR